MNSICNMCNMVDTKRGSENGPEWCDECDSVEQGFIELQEDVDINGTTFCVDEDGGLRDDITLELVGSIIE